MKQQDLFGGPPAKPTEPPRTPAAAAPAAPALSPSEPLERPEPSEPLWVRARPPDEVVDPPTVAPEPVPAWRREASKKAEPKVLSVAELTRQIKETIEPAFSRV